MKKFTVLGSLLFGAVLGLNAQTAKVQVIHNCPDAPSVDIYVVQGTTVTKLDDFKFRTATSFIELAAGVETIVYVAFDNSTSINDAIFAKPYESLPEGMLYLVAAGELSLAKSETNNENGFDLFVSPASDNADADKTNLLVFHGIADAPAVDVSARDLDPVRVEFPGTVLVPNLSFGQFTENYLELPTIDGYVIDLKVNSTGDVVSSCGLPLASYQAAGASALVVASGKLSTGDFGLFAVAPEGGDFFELPTNAYVQVIHNSADVLLSVVDLYVKFGSDEVKLDDVAFRTATSYLELPSDVDISVVPALATSTTSAEGVANIPVGKLLPGYYYQVIASGIFSPSGYNPAKAFELLTVLGRPNAYNNDNFDVQVLHGATDAPAVDVLARG
ncbi:MAG: DUF4397 domain-containing protein, partial [Cytophagales bacterium]